MHMHVCICVSKLKSDLLESLEKRFGDSIETDLCLISAFLDPRFGPKVFTAQKREMVKMRVKYHLALIVPRNNVQTHTFSEKVPSNFIFHVVETEASIKSFDDYDILKSFLVYLLQKQRLKECLI